MIAKKKTTKKTVKKAPVKKTAATKPVSVKSAVPKSAAKKTPAKKVLAETAAAKKPVVPRERFYAMISEAAYFSAQNDGNKKGSVEYWIEAEAAVRAKFNVA
ncbi:MAG: DUF2934 domain-containing protein [Kiritimatiellales bacterium]